MNKLLKGSIAAAAGVALLMGGAGTFAYWNDSAPLTGNTITAGNLTVTAAAGSGTWTNAAGTTYTDTTIANYRIVPGDVLTYTKDVSIVAVGDTLKATVALGSGAIAAVDTGNANDNALASLLTANTVVGISAATGVSGTAPNYTITAGVTIPATVTATITFPFAPLPIVDNPAKLGKVTLSGLSVTVTQIAQ
jgi:alternate signal-mediated exported protein